MKTLRQLRTELLQRDKKFRELYEKEDRAYELAKAVINARLRKNLTQKALALRIGTHQSGVARFERGNSLPSLTLVAKIEEALQIKLLEVISEKPSIEISYLNFGAQTTSFLKQFSSIPDSAGKVDISVRDSQTVFQERR